MKSVEGIHQALGYVESQIRQKRRHKRTRNWITCILLFRKYLNHSSDYEIQSCDGQKQQKTDSNESNHNLFLWHESEQLEGRSPNAYYIQTVMRF